MTLASGAERTALPGSAADAVPLPEAAEGLWYAQHLDPDNPVYWTTQRVDIDGYLDVPAFANAVATAMDEADGLRMRIIPTADGPRCHRDDGRAIRLDVIDLRRHPDPSAVLDDWLARDAARSRDPATDPLVEQSLFLLPDHRHCWYQGIHHVAIDGFGTSLLTRRIVDLYRARLAGMQTPHPLGSFTDILREDADYRASMQRVEHAEWWRQAFDGLGEVGSLAPGTAASADHALRARVPVDSRLAVAVQECATRAQVTWPDVVVALIAAYVARHTGDRETVLGVPTMNRFGSAVARVPAMAMNILPVRVAIDEDLPLAAHCTAVATTLRQARRRGRYRSEQLRRDLNRLGGQRRLYGVMVNILPFDESLHFPEATATLTSLGTGPVEDLTILVRADATGAGLRIDLEANPRLYPAAAVQAHAERLASFLLRATRAGTLGDVDTLDGDAIARWLATANPRPHPVPDRTLTDLVEDVLRNDPERTALIGPEGSLGYGDVERRSRAMAHLLVARGVRPGDIVAVSIPRSFDLVIALVAILRAGGAWLPIDPEHPIDRRRVMLGIATPRLHLVRDDADRIGDPAVPEVMLRDAPGDTDLPLPPSGVGQDDLAYLIFTSGSTGEPKGVMIEHRAIVNRLEWMRETFEIGGDARVLLKTPATFDVSVWEFFLPLIAGATLVVAPPGAHRDPAALRRLIIEHGVTVAHFVPSMLALFLEQPGLSALPLELLFCSGEVLPAALRDRCHALLTARLHNLYGPTEAAVDVTWWDASAPDASAPLPIGHPVWNTEAWILDPRGRLVPPGVVGELHLGGVQLARGYAGRDDLTAARFAANPYAPEERLYATGDRAAWRDDGAIVYHGRTDHQVKIRGIRIECGDVEAALERLDDVAHAVVMLRDNAAGEPRLVAWLVPAAGRSVEPTAVRRTLAALLPEAMIPSAFVLLDALPVTANGKLDRGALPLPSLRAATAASRALTPAEQRVRAAFAAVLGLPEEVIGVDDDFFVLGGHSLRAVRLVTALQISTGETLPLGAVFTAPTVARLALHLEQVSTNGVDAMAGLDAVILLAGDPTSSREPLYCVHPAGGIAWCYGALARAMDGRAVHGLQSRGLEPDEDVPATLEALADEYVARILARHPGGRVHLAGWSIGGLIAQAMAVRLEALGHAVGALVLLDAYPSDRWRLADEPTEESMLRALLLMAGEDPARHAAVTRDREAIIRFLRERNHPLGSLPDRALHGVMRVVAHNNRLVRTHRHARYAGTLRHIAASLDHGGTGIRPDEWTPYVHHLETFALPTTHPGMAGTAMAPSIARHILDMIGS